MSMADIEKLHNRAALNALNARSWFYRGRLDKSDGDFFGAYLAVGAWREAWDWAEEASQKASKLEEQHGSVFPGVA
jgi:hypothetical protein